MDKKFTKFLPKLPGIYLFRNQAGEVLYIGKAKCLSGRVRSYFQKYGKDWKIDSLIKEHEDIDYILTKNETEALLLEAQLIRKYKPKFNILLKNGQPFIYLLFSKENIPRLKIVRNKKEGGLYFGPFLHKTAARSVYNYLIKTFRLFLCNKKIKHGCLDYHIGNCAGSCMPNFDYNHYLLRLNLAINALKNNHVKFIKAIKANIVNYNSALEFEKSKHLAEYLTKIDTIFTTLKTKFSEKKYESAIFAATIPYQHIKNNYSNISDELKNIFNLKAAPKTIDCFDISHFQSNYLVGSCVRFTNGTPDKSNFRKFKIRTLERQNDCAALQEIVLRRYKDRENLPDLILIDGGKAQLNSIKKILTDTPCLSLAKKEETVFSPTISKGIKLNNKKGFGQLLISLRDYTHHFAISFHRIRRSKFQK